MVEKSWKCQQAVSVTILISKHFYLMTKKVDLYKRCIKGCDPPYPGQAAHLGSATDRDSLPSERFPVDLEMIMHKQNKNNK